MVMESLRCSCSVQSFLIWLKFWHWVDKKLSLAYMSADEHSRRQVPLSDAARQPAGAARGCRHRRHGTGWPLKTHIPEHVAQVTAGDTVRFKPLSLPEAAALRAKADAQVALLGGIATGALSAADAEAQLQVCLIVNHD